MQHMVSLVQLGVLRSVRAGGELQCNSPPARTLLKTPSCTKDTIRCICKGNYKFYCSWRWAYRPETFRAKLNKYLHQVGNWLLWFSVLRKFFNTRLQLLPFSKYYHRKATLNILNIWLFPWRRNKVQYLYTTELLYMQNLDAYILISLLRARKTRGRTKCS